MKTLLRHDFRREASELIKSSNLSIHTIATQMGVHLNTARNWKLGLKPPTQRNFEQLKKLAAGELTHTAGEEKSMMMAEILKGIGELKGIMSSKFSELEKRIAKVEEKKTHS